MSNSDGRRVAVLDFIGPGLLVAATGVGAGDLLNTALAGAELGTSLILAAVLGALLKWSLNEGIARWQMATGTTVLEGWTFRLGRWVRWLFLAYFLVWSLMVGTALINACGVAGDALFPLGSRSISRPAWGIIHSLVGLALVWLGGFKLFERIMAACIAAMFVGVVLTAVLLRPDWTAIARSLVHPRLDRSSLLLSMGVLGGVGGTVTLLSYGYWIREAGRSGVSGLRACRIDLAVAYAGTCLFGIAMLVISSRVQLGEGGADVALRLADQLAIALGPLGRHLFLIGFWGAVFSSLLGVWQSAPYLFADFLRLGRDEGSPAERLNLRNTWPYRGFLFALALLPMAFLGFTVKQIQVAYAVMGALFMPFLAFTLLIMNNRRQWVGDGFRSGLALNTLLIITLLVFAAMGWLGIPAG